jgi:hypothetical protein
MVSDIELGSSIVSLTYIPSKYSAKIESLYGIVIR